MPFDVVFVDPQFVDTSMPAQSPRPGSIGTVHTLALIGAGPQPE
jgi:hypothetical protein